MVWLSKNVKEEMRDRLNEAAAFWGYPDLVDKIADGDSVNDVDQLMAWCDEKQHPALTMPPIIG